MSLIGALKAVGQRRARQYKNIYLPLRRSNEKLADDDSYINSALSQIDSDASAINWCTRWINRFHPNFAFHHIPAHNARYNPSSSPRRPLPFEEASFELAFLNSVFSHMLTEDVQFYLGEMHKLLIPGGLIYATAFVEESVPEEEENPEGYLNKNSAGPLHRVRYEKNFLLGLFEQAGFHLVDFVHHGIERTGQSVIVARKE